MPKTIDQRVVEMQFDNRNFEKNVSQSMSTLDKLKEKLNFRGASKAADELNNSVKKFDFNPVASALTTVGEKFSALEQIGIGALRRIGEQAVQTGERLIKSLSIDNISAGWEKFGEKTVAVATLRAQGYEMERINEQLEKLNFFTDETSYNFTAMVGSIGKFTASGKDLEESVTAMEGIATWAALSGQNATTASLAMYQLSQAMGAGIMRREDYRSIQNASMDTAEFRQKAIDAALALGTLEEIEEGVYKSVSYNPKEIEKAYFTIDSFADHLTADMWFTSDVMMKVYKDYGKAANAIQEYMNAYDVDTASQAIEMLEEQAKALVDVGKTATIDEAFLNVIAEMPGMEEKATAFMNEYNASLEEGQTRITDWHDALVEMGYGIDEFSLKAFRAGQEARTWTDVIDSVKDAVGTGWSNTFESIFGNYEESKKLWTRLANDFWDIFASGGESRNDMFDAWRNYIDPDARNMLAATPDSVTKAELTEKNMIDGRDLLFSTDEENLGAFIQMLETLKNLLAIIKDSWNEVMFGTTDADEIATKKADILMSVTKAIKSFADSLAIDENKAENLRQVFKGVFSAFDLAGKTIVAVIKGFEPLKPVLADIGSYIADLIKHFANWSTTANENAQQLGTFEAITESVAAVVKKVIDVISAGIGIVRDFSEAVASIFVSKEGNVGDSAADFADRFSKMSEFAQKVIDKFTAFGELFRKLWDKITPIFSALGDGISSAIDSITSAFNGSIDTINIDTIAKVIETITEGGAILALSKLIKYLKNFGTDFNLKSILGIDDILSGVSEALGSFASVLKAQATNLNVDSVSKISGSILVLVAALFVLTLIDTDKLKNAVTVLVELFATLMGSFAVVAKMQKSIKSLSMSAIGAAFVELAAAMLILSAAMSKIADLSWEGIGKALATMAVTIKLLPEALNSTEPKGAFKKALSMILLTTSLVILSAAMRKIADLSWEGIGKALATMAVTIKLLPEALNSTEPKGALKKALSMILLTTSLVILSAAMSKIADLSWEGIGKALAAMFVALGIMTGSMNLLQEPNIGKAVSLSVVASLLPVLAQYMNSVADLSWEDIGKALSAMLASLGLMVLSINLMDGKGALKKAAGLVVVGVALTAIALSLKLLSSIGWPGLLVGLVGLVAVITILGLSAKILGPLTGNIMKLSVSIATFSASMALFGVSTITVGAGLIAIGMGLTAIGASFPVIAAGLSALVPALAEELPVLMSGIALAIATAAPDIAEAIKSVITAILTVVHDSLPELVSTLFDTLLLTIQSLAAAIPSIVEAILIFINNLLTQLNANLPTIVVNLFALILGLLGALSEYTPQIIDKLLNIIIGILHSTAERIPDLSDAITEFITSLFAGIFSIAGGLLGTLIGEMANSFGTAIADGLPHIGEKLSEFSSSISPFLGMVSGISEDSMKGVKLLAETILLITAAELISSVGDFLSFFGGSQSSSFGDTIVSFGTSIAAFADATKDIDGEKVASSANAAKALAGFANAIPKEGGLWQEFFGTGDLTKFGKELEDFAPHFVAYANKVADIKNTDAVTASADAATSLANFAGKLPKHDGIWQDWVGDSSLTTFAEELKSFAPALVSYADSVTGLDGNAVKNSVLAAESLSNFASKLPKHDGIWQDWVGDSSLTTFAEELKSFAPAFVEYANSVAGLDTEAVVASATAASMLAALETNLPDSGGVVSWFAGDNTLSSFSEGLPKLGTALHDYAVNLGDDFDTNKVSVATAAATALSILQNGLSDSGGVVSWFAGDNTLSGFSEGLPKLGTALHDYATNLGDFDPAVVASSSKALESLSSLEAGLSNSGGLEAAVNGDNTLKTFGESIGSLGKGIENFYDSVKDVETTEIKKVISAFTEALENNKPTINDKFQEIARLGLESWADVYPNYKNAGKITVENVASGFGNSSGKLSEKICETLKTAIGDITNVYSDFRLAGDKLSEQVIDGYSEGFKGESRKSQIQNAGEDTADQFITGFAGRYENVSNAGKFAVQGLVRAVKDMAPEAQEAGEEIAKSLASGIELTLEIRSPSRVTYGLGKFAGLGFINALNDQAAASGQAGGEIGRSATDGIREALERSASAFDTSVNVEPTIRPVLDLSNVNSGIGVLGGMFDTSYSVGLAGSARMSMSETGMNVQNEIKTDNSDVVAELGYLRQDINEMTERITNMQIYLDKNVLVGEMAEPMNRALGSSYRHSRRER